MSNRIAAIARTTARPRQARGPAGAVLRTDVGIGRPPAPVPIPGHPRCRSRMQTFVVMLAGLMLTPAPPRPPHPYACIWAPARPVCRCSPAAWPPPPLVSPSGGFLIGFLPGVVVAALLKGAAKGRLTALRYFAACLAGCVVVVYAFGNHDAVGDDRRAVRRRGPGLRRLHHRRSGQGRRCRAGCRRHQPPVCHAHPDRGPRYPTRLVRDRHPYSRSRYRTATRHV